jgi:sulfate adenylyltransferase subunit 1 (EFTu-like GTPase family)
MLVVSGVVLLELRREAWDKAGQTSIDLLQVIERDIARNVEIFDLSLQGVVESLRTPGINAIGQAMRQLVLFDRAATTRDMGAMFVLDEHGDVTVDAGALQPRRADLTGLLDRAD